jgi:hypothetical protein
MSKPKFREICGFDDRPMMLVGIPLASSLIGLLIFSDIAQKGDWQYFVVCIPISIVYTTIYWLSMRWFYSQMRLRYPGTDNVMPRLLGNFLAFLFMYLVINHGVDQLLIRSIFKDRVVHDEFTEFISTFLLSSLVIAIYEASSFAFQLQKTVTEKANLERHYVESQLEGLRNQVNPHFLFNSLNTLIYLIPEDADKAVRFVQQLSKVYRYVLESRDAKTILLGEELKFLHSYIFLQKERFGENLQVELSDLTDRNNQAIVPLSLQLLFENAIKHNVISTEKPLKIEVFAENGALIVRNNLQKKNQIMESTGVGLQNIKDRYQLLSQKPVDVIVSTQFFTVAIPLLNPEPETLHT